MKKFRIELLFVALGVLLVLCTAGQLCWERVAYADTSACTQAPNSDNHACAGTNVVLSCSGCNYNTSGTTWYDPITRGSTSGSSKVEFTSVNCKSVVPCTVATLYKGRRCTGTGACLAAIFTPSWAECSHYAAGPAQISVMSTCHTVTCEEE
jgi:hypothetical protein